MTVGCKLCPFNCDIPLGQTGKCKVRGNMNGMVSLLTYGRITTMIDGPVEQKPFYHFHPGMRVLSIGGSGCNMRCAYCQNFEISQVGDAKSEPVEPMAVVRKARNLGCEGIAFTYSEPIVWYEYVMNVAVAAKKSGLKTLLKTNGYCETQAFSEMADWMDAINIDFKGNARLYRDVADIELPEDPMEWIITQNLRTAARKCHVEVSMVCIPPWCNEPSMHNVFRALKNAAGEHLPIHLLKFIPDYKMRNMLSPTPAELEAVKGEAEMLFRHVYIDFAGVPAKTFCNTCERLLVERNGLEVVRNKLIRGNRCGHCMAINNFEGKAQ